MKLLNTPTFCTACNGISGAYVSIPRACVRYAESVESGSAGRASTGSPRVGRRRTGLSSPLYPVIRRCLGLAPDDRQRPIRSPAGGVGQLCSDRSISRSITPGCQKSDRQFSDASAHYGPYELVSPSGTARNPSIRPSTLGLRRRRTSVRLWPPFPVGERARHPRERETPSEMRAPRPVRARGRRSPRRRRVPRAVASRRNHRR